MKTGDFQNMTVERLVERFAEVALAQDEAILSENSDKYNRLFDHMTLLKQELKSRAGDQRRALLPLCDHKNAQVRLQAAIAIVAVAPNEARQTFQIISDRDEYPEAADARSWIRTLNEGRFKPA